MALPQTINGVPKGQVGSVVQSFIDNDGAKKVVVEEEPGGSTCTVRAE